MSEPLRVLIVDDSEDDAELLARELRRGGASVTWKRVESEPQLVQAIEREHWDVILCDYTIPGFGAEAALRALARLDIDLPVIIVSGTIGEERAVECMRLGAHDLVLKDRLARLLPAVERELAEAVIHREQSRLRQELERSHETLARSERLRAIGQMTAGISHDLKNLLSPMALELQIIAREAKDNAEIRESISNLQQLIVRSTEMINRLREFSKQVPAKMQPVDLDAIAREAVQVLKPRAARESRVRLTESLGRPPKVMGDPGELLSAVVNLVLNAIEALTSGGTITVATAARGEESVLTVSDDGPGIPAEVQAMVFEPFFTTKGETGTGLGLSMVHGCMVRHEGQVRLESTLGKGTTFELRFPQKKTIRDRAASHS